MFVSTHHTSCDVRKAAAMVTEAAHVDPSDAVRPARRNHDCELELMAVKFESPAAACTAGRGARPRPVVRRHSPSIMPLHPL